MIKKISLLFSFLIPLILSANYVMNHFYVNGGGVFDTGWFSFLLTNPGGWPLQNPSADMFNHTFFSTHFSPFFYIGSFVYNLTCQLIPKSLYYSLFIGSMYGIISLSTFIAGSYLIDNKIDNNKKYLVLLSCISILSAFNGVALGLIGFPHIEIAIPALILLFVALYFTDKRKLSYIVFIILLSVREDAGFHFFGLIFIIIALHFILTKNVKIIPKSLIALLIVSFAYSIIVIFLQMTYFPGKKNTLEDVYFGNPYFAHLTGEYIYGKIVFFLNYREYIYLPFLFTMIFSVCLKNIFFLSGFLSTIPWFLLSITAVSNMASSFSNYYAFPFISALSWPFFAVLINQKFNTPKKLSYPNLSYPNIFLSVLFITILSIVTFPQNIGNVDAKPWENFGFNSIGSVINTEKFVKHINKEKNKFGNILFDEPMAALFIDSLQTSEYGYLNDFNDQQTKRVNTVIFSSSNNPINKVSKEIMNQIILKNKLEKVYTVKKTNIIMATNKDMIDGFSLYNAKSLYNSLVKQYKIEPGCSIKFNSNNVFFKDWSIEEVSHRWSLGKSSEILFVFANIENLQGILRLRIKTLGEQNIRLVINNQRIQSRKINSIDAVIDFKFNPEILKKDEINTIKFEYSNPHKPDNGDQRVLAMGLKSFQVI